MAGSTELGSHLKANNNPENSLGGAQWLHYLRDDREMRTWPVHLICWILHYLVNPPNAPHILSFRPTFYSLAGDARALATRKQTP